MKKINIAKFFELLPIIIMSSIVPLVVFLKPYNVDSSVISFFAAGKSYVDLYSYYKMVGVVIALIIMIINVAILIKSKDNRLKNVYSISAMLLMVFLVLATLMSEYSQVVYFGFPDRFEGFYVWLAYFLLIPYTYNILKSKEEFVFVMKCFLLSSFIVAFIGIVEYFGYHLYSQEWFVKMIAPASIRDSITNISYAFSKYRVSGSLYNPNFVGSYMIVSVFSTLALYMIEKKNKCLYLSAMFLASFALTGSKSSAGQLGIFISVIVFVVGVLLLRSNKKYVLIGIVLLAPMIIEPMISGGNSLIEQEIGTISSGNIVKDNIFYKDITLENNRLTVRYDDKEFVIELNGDQVTFLANDNEPLVYSILKSDGILEFEDEAYKDVVFRFIPDSNAAELKIGKIRLLVGFEKDGLVYADSRRNVFEETNVIEKFGFEGYESIGNSRGYIWSRSLPIVFDSIIIGKGPDVYPMYFPQTDLIGKLNWLGDYGMMVDKPHNSYIQMAINQGLVSVIIYVAMIFILGIRLLMDIIKKKKNVSLARLSLYSGVLGYSVAGIFNDSNVCVSPAYWVMLSLTILLEYKDEEFFFKNKLIKE